MSQNLIYVIRILAAGICGIAIGSEREYRAKAAGVRTHFLIAIAAAVMTVISKYGFLDTLNLSGASVDTSRVAAGILAGVGLMSGGLVIMGKQEHASGLTTAAGIWVTMAVGMAIGAGMYVVGIAATGIALLGQLLMHRHWAFLRYSWRGQMEFRVRPGEFDGGRFLQDMQKQKIEITRITVDAGDPEWCRIKVLFACTTTMDREEMTRMVRKLPGIISFEF